MTPSPLEPLRCEACGAPVPLSDHSPTPCAHCGAAVPLPPAHLELFRHHKQGAKHLAMANDMWARLPPPMPAFLPALFVVSTIATVFALVSAWAIFFLDAFGGPGGSFVIVVMIPAFGALQLGLELLAWWAPFKRLEDEFSAFAVEGVPEIAACRSCGAPLRLHDNTFVTRCAFCQTDNLVRRLRRAAVQHARRAAQSGRKSIDDAIATLRMLRLQRKVVRWLGPAIMLPLAGVMLLALWGR